MVGELRRDNLVSMCSLVGVTYPFDIEFNMDKIDEPWLLWNILDLANHPRKNEFAEELLRPCRKPLENLSVRLDAQLKLEYLKPPQAFLPGEKNREFIWRLASKAAKKEFLTRCFQDAADAKADLALKQVDKKWRAKCISVIKQAYQFFIKEHMAKERISKRKADAILKLETNKRVRRGLQYD
jgi:hypothetical protein